MVSGLDLRRARAAVRMSEREGREFVEHEATALEERRERRRVKGIGNRRPRCQACASFLCSSSQECPQCGYREGLGR